MNDSDEKKLVRYLFIILLGSLILYKRESILGDNPTVVDVIFISLFLIIFLYPLFKEFTIGGISLKKELEETKNEINDKINELKIDIITSQVFNPTINLGYPNVNDSGLENLSKKIDESIKNAVKQYGVSDVSDDNLGLVSPDVNYVFRARYLIEKELRRIWTDRNFSIEYKKYPTVYDITKTLAKFELIPFEYTETIKEIYNVCSPIIHGEETDSYRLEMVKKYAPYVISTLKKIV